VKRAGESHPLIILYHPARLTCKSMNRKQFEVLIIVRSDVDGNSIPLRVKVLPNEHFWTHIPERIIYRLGRTS